MKSPTSFTLFAAAATLAVTSATEFFTGDGTAYTLGDTTSGNCNMMSSLGFATTDYAALNNEQWDGLQNCGRCAEVTCADSRCTDKTKSVVVQILDRCPECKHGDLDLSPSVFKTLTGSDPSRYTIKWKFVDCPVTGNVNYCLKGGSNNFWTAIQPTNVATGIKSLQINGKATTMLDGAYYYLLDGSGKASTDLSKVTVSLMDVNGVSMKDTVSLSAGSCTKGTKQFPSSGRSKSGLPATNTTKPTPAPTTVAPEVVLTPAPIAQTSSPTVTPKTPASTPTVTTAQPSEEQQTSAPVATTPMPVTPTETDAPVTDAPVTQIDTPVTEAPATDAPVTQIDTPATEAPATDAPVTQIDTPVTDAPVTDAPVTQTDTPTETEAASATGPISEDSSWVDVLDCDQKPGQNTQQSAANGDGASNIGDETQQQSSVGGENSADSPDSPATVAPVMSSSASQPSAEEGSDAENPAQQSSYGGDIEYSTSAPTVPTAPITSSSASEESGSTSVGGEAETPSQDANSVGADNSQSFEQNSSPASYDGATDAPVTQESGSDDTLHGSDVAGSADQDDSVTEAPASGKDCPM
ncbi:unnamed protein product [Phytophthora fragariaefolia]|uniref:Unnamed protein product n=1 Tax=Phytophthora fragariaefolia TaxID=1490495 RepID=A0A9W6UDE3_9STRA|nr:unnamed protein product [Phytophthora fragariaefolia]